MNRVRIDHHLVQIGLACDTRRAAALVLRGAVVVNDQRVDKVGTLIDPDSRVRLTLQPSRYASRGGDKLEPVLALPHFSVEGRVCLDLGASTGGFTDCLLQHGALMVYAVDVGRGQLAWSLQQDPRVKVMDRVNVRFLDLSLLEPPPEIITIDLSFISLKAVLPILQRLPSLKIAALVKPQFEARRDEVGSGGIIRDADLRNAIVERVRTAAIAAGFSVIEQIDSPLKGQKGNQEVFLLLSWER